MTKQKQVQEPAHTVRRATTKGNSLIVDDKKACGFIPSSLDAEQRDRYILALTRAINNHTEMEPAVAVDVATEKDSLDRPVLDEQGSPRTFRIFRLLCEQSKASYTYNPLISKAERKNIQAAAVAQAIGDLLA